MTKSNEKLGRFGKGVKLSLDKVYTVKDAVRDASLGGAVGFGVHYFKSRDLKEAAWNTAKNMGVGMIVGLGVTAIANGVVTASQPGYLEYLEDLQEEDKS